MNFYSAVFSFILIMPLYCSAQQDAQLNANGIDTIPTEKLILYKEDSIIVHDRQQLYLQNLSKLMEMPILINGRNQFYIRIWIWNFNEKYVININENKLNKTCGVIEFDQKKLDSNYYIAIKHEWENLKPRSGWDSFFRTLERYQIPVMKSGRTSKDYKDHLTHSIYIQFEVVQAGQYRFYEFLEPAFYRYVEPGAMNVYKFLKYFQKEMGLKVYYISDKLYAKPR